MMIAPASDEHLLLAGLESRWTDPKTGETAPAVVIMTTSPNELLAGIHDRMPVIVPEASWGRWLDPDADAGDVADLLAPFPAEGLTARPVSTLVNNVAWLLSLSSKCFWLRR
jgi:putative SOS response-associated peptidase YedK